MKVIHAEGGLWRVKSFDGRAVGLDHKLAGFEGCSLEATFYSG